MGNTYIWEVCGICVICERIRREEFPADGADILRLKGGVPIPQLTLITDHLKRLEIGATLNGKELAEISQVLRSANEVHHFFMALADEKVELNYLYELEEQLETLPQLAKRLQVSLEADGYVTDDASSLLRSLRRQISTTEATIRNRLVALTRGNNAKYLSGANVTIRNDRYVIPVRAEHKGKFGGIVHDQSSSGQTYFIEPREIVELNNRLKQEQVAEKKRSCGSYANYRKKRCLIRLSWHTMLRS